VGHHQFLVEVDPIGRGQAGQEWNVLVDPAEVDVRAHFTRPPVLIADLPGKGGDRPAGDQRIVRRAGRRAGTGERVEAVAAAHAADKGRVHAAEGAAEIGHHRLRAANVAAEALADRRAEANVVPGRPHREWLDIALDRTAIADPGLVDA